MIKSRESLSQHVLKFVMVGIAASCLGAAVMAAPLSVAPRGVVTAGQVQATASKVAYAPLASGPALQLSPAAAGEDEDCVRVTTLTGPDGQVYPTRGLVCGQ
jgi:hypothetical protein